MNPDDPKFTAHALGEVEDLTAAERAEIESLLASDPSALAEAEEMRSLAARLRVELPGEKAAALRDEQRAAVLGATIVPPVDTKNVVPFPKRALWLVAAACVAIGISAALWLPTRPSAKPTESSAVAVTPVVTSIPAEPLAGAGSLIASNPAPAPIAPEMPKPATIEGKNEERILALTASGNAPAAAASIEVPADLPAAAPVPVGQVAITAPQPQTAPAETSPTVPLTGRDVPSKIAPFTAGWAKGGTASLTPSEKDSSKLASTRAEDAKNQAVTKSPATLTSPAAALRLPVAEPEPREIDVAWQRPVPRSAMLAKSTLATLSADAVRVSGDVEDQRRRRDVMDPDPQTAEAFDELRDNAFLTARENPLSTFSIDVDTASYAIVRRFLNHNQQPPKGAVRIEELLNYFTYDYAPPRGETPFSAAMEVAACPWAPEHRLVRIGLKGREIARDERPASNLVFLIDVSGSMRPENKLPLLRQSLDLLIDQLGAEDQVAIVVYAGNSGCVLEPTHDKRKMHAALRKLEAGGSTNGGSGLQLAYSLAEKGFIKGGTNRVILATDGDWNVGITDHRELLDVIKRKAKTGVFLTVLGVGMDNLKDTMLVKLADNGNGNYAYLDTVLEAKKVLVDQLSGTLVTIAKDVKIQVEFNPAQVGAYRLVGYEKRMLAKQDFNNDKKDAGEIGAGHTVTALYEIVPPGEHLVAGPQPVDPLKYQQAPAAGAAPTAPDLGAYTKPEDAFVNAYMIVQDAEKAEQAGKLPSALSKYRHAAALFDEIVQRSPDWQPAILQFRQKRSAEAIARIEAQLSPTDGKPSQPGDAATQPPDANTEAERALVENQFIALKSGFVAQLKKIDKTTVPASREMLTLKLRYKEPEGEVSKLIEFPLSDPGTPWEKSSTDFRFAAAVAGYGMLLRDSSYKGEATWSAVTEWAMEGKGTDASGYRAEFLSLVDKARAVSR